MVTLAATSSATPSLQASLLRSRVDQARREAEDAEGRAEDLRRRAESADRDAQQQRNAERSAQRQLADVDASTYSRPSRTPPATPEVTRNFITRVYQVAAPRFAAEGNPLKVPANAPAVRNSQGQTTSRILSLTA